MQTIEKSCKPRQTSYSSNTVAAGFKALNPEISAFNRAFL
jgi:hypothetical protein